MVSSFRMLMQLLAAFLAGYLISLHTNSPGLKHMSHSPDWLEVMYNYMSQHFTFIRTPNIMH